MDAPILRLGILVASLFISTGATFQTRNFTVTAPTVEVAEKVGKAAEDYRRDLATFWVGKPLPNWFRPCTIRVKPGAIGAGGETKFQFVGGHVINWTMYVQGSLERILDSVLPHEVNHTIFACHFRRPLPRWADEGAATLFEHRSEQKMQLELLQRILDKRDFIPLQHLLNMKEYPSRADAMRVLYAEGYALVDFLVQQKGRQQYLLFLADGEKMGWEAAIRKNYDHGGVNSLQQNWRGWILAGMPKLSIPPGQMLASSDSEARDTARPAILDQYRTAATVRSQSPDANSSHSRSSRSSRSATDAPLWTAARSSKDSPTDSPLSVENKSRPTSDAVQRPTRWFSLEAPSPGRAPRAAGDHAVKTSVETPAESAGFEKTAIRQETARSLPQERNMVTGHTPQWAGFPGQKELF